MVDDLSRALNALPGLVWTALPDGHIDFYVEGDVIWSNYRLLVCRSGGWQILRSGPSSSVGSPTGGRYTPTR